MPEDEVNFNALLDKQADDIKPPQPLPLGTYLFIVQKKEYGVSSQKKTPYLRVYLKPMQAEADVDPVQLQELDLEKMTLRDEFYLTEAAMYRLKEFVEKCGISTTGRQMLECVNSIDGCYVKAHVKIRPNKDRPGHPGFNEVTDYTSVEG
jgi:hypothetical protein